MCTARHPGLRERRAHHRVVAQRRQQNGAFQPQLPHQHAHIARHLLARDVERLHHQMQVRFAAALHGAGLELVQVVARLVVEETDEERAGAGQAPGVEIWLIIELPDGFQDTCGRAFHPGRRARLLIARETVFRRGPARDPLPLWMVAGPPALAHTLLLHEVR